MEIKIIKQEPGYVKLSIRGTDPHTLFNLLREELLEDSEVDFAGYWRSESFYEALVFQVRMKKTTDDPIPAIYSALERIIGHTHNFIEAVKAKIV